MISDGTLNEGPRRLWPRMTEALPIAEHPKNEALAQPGLRDTEHTVSDGYAPLSSE